MEHESDAALVAAARGGGREAFGAIYDRYGDALHRFCVSVLGDFDEAADAVQDAFLIAARSLDRLRDPERLRPWLYAIARHEAIRRGRATSRVVPTDDLGYHPTTMDVPEDAVRSEDAVRIVWDAAAGLNERDRALLALHVREGLDGEELARAMGVRTGAVYMMVNRLKAQVERSIGALLLARLARRECAELRALLDDWDGSFSPVIRKRVARHADGCATCTAQRRTLASPLALLAAAPVLPAPAGLRERVLERVDRASSVGRAGPALGRDGFPRPRVPWRAIAVAVTVGAAVGGGVVLGIRTSGDDAAGVRPSTPATESSSPTALVEAAGEFTSYPGAVPSTPGPNVVILSLPEAGGTVTGSSEWAVDAGGGTTTVRGVWRGNYDAAGGRLSGTADITTTGPQGQVLGRGTASWSATYESDTRIARGTLESDDGPWGFTVRGALTRE